ncbi:hypothetical protein ACHQM5_030412 [Ranunculus cassubicifolius]
MDSSPSQSGRYEISNNNRSDTINNINSPESPARSSSYGLGNTSQSLASILNNPHVGKSGVYGSDASWLTSTLWWSSSSSSTIPTELPPLTIKHTVPDVLRSEFDSYLSSILESYSRFEDIRHHNSNRDSEELLEGAGQGEALVACLREVPSLYFKEDFALEEGATFRAACPFLSPGENMVLQEKLSYYLDTVELHLVKEISLRSNSFFEAQGQLQDLNVGVLEACGRIRELKETIRLLDADLVQSARAIQDLNGTRSNLLALQEKLRLILYVNQALSALKLLVAAADCAGALDVTDDLQHLLDSDELAGLHCFRHVRDQLATSVDSVNSILSAEFMRASVHDAKDVDLKILARLKARPTKAILGKEDEVKLDEDETSSFRDRLLPIIIGLLRTAKLPTVLRIYRDTLVADMKTAIKTTVAEFLPILVARPLESDLTSSERNADGDGGGSSLGSKLRNLSSESFVLLLDAIFKVVQAHLVRAAEVKKSIEWIMCNVDDTYAVDSVTTSLALGAAVAETGQESSPYSLQKNVNRIPLIQGKLNDSSSPLNMARNFRADVLRENTEAIFAACDTAHGRWAKLLGVRAHLHPKLRLQEFLSIYNITQEFITATEKIGGRLGYSIRGTLQSQSKAFVDSQHESRMAKIKAVLDQETWVLADVPEEFQSIVDNIISVEASINGHQDSDSAIISSEVISTNDDKLEADGEVENREELSSSLLRNGQNTKEKKKASRMIMYKDVGYRLANCGLILLKMLSDYIDMNHFLPTLSSELVHRVVEILKHFNTRTCQLVLGAGAMQVSGLKSITAKHLALASQVISFVYALIPDIKRILFVSIPESRKTLLLLEIDRVAQDYKVHRDEIHTKLVQIMRERLLLHLRILLPKAIEAWNCPDDGDMQKNPSQFAQTVTKEVGYLHSVLPKILHETEVRDILRQVVQACHTILSDAFSKLEISTPQAKKRLYQDTQHILGCLRLLPSDPSEDGVPNSGKLDEFLAQRFGNEGGGS